MLSSRRHRERQNRRYAVLQLPAMLVGLVLTGAPTAAWTFPAAPPDDAATTTRAVDDAETTTGPPTTQAEARPKVRAIERPLDSIADGAVPDAADVAEKIGDELASDWLGPEDRRAVTVRDALSGTPLVETNSDRLVTPASTTKILSAAAIVSALPIEHTFTTRVVTGESADEVVLVAGGDMLLARQEGDHEAVAGHAGMGDLAEQTAAALEAKAVNGPVTVGLDLQHVPGPEVLETWTDFWVSEGYTGRIVQLGLAEDLALPFYPAPRDPVQEAARAFAEALDDAGVEVAGAEGADDGWQDWTADVVETPAGRPQFDAEVDAATTTRGPGDAAGVTTPAGVEVLASVESAPLRDVLALALAASDNAMVEQLARQAAVADGAAGDRESVTDWISATIAEGYGIDMTGMNLADASGLSPGTELTVDAVADVLVAGADGSHPELQAVLAAGGLPIAGYTGTLRSRFHLEVHEPAIGNARAKTGSLPGVTSLAGTVVTADGRLLVYSMTADAIGADGAVLEARSMLDEIVAELARCGC